MCIPSEQNTHHRTAPQLSEDQRRELYTLYYQDGKKIHEIVEIMHCTRITINRHLKRFAKALQVLRPHRKGSKVTLGPDYAQYTDQVLAATRQLPGRWAHTRVAERFIYRWWQRQTKHSAHPQLTDPKPIYDAYCTACSKKARAMTETGGAIQQERTVVSMKTFQRLLTCILKEDYQPKIGRPKKRRGKQIP